MSTGTYWLWASSSLGEVRKVEIDNEPIIESWGITYFDSDGSKVWRPWARIVKIECVSDLMAGVDSLLHDLDAGPAAE